MGLYHLSTIFFFSFFKFSFLTRTSYRLVLVMCFSETNFFLGDSAFSTEPHPFFPPYSIIDMIWKSQTLEHCGNSRWLFSGNLNVETQSHDFIDSRSTPKGFPGLCMQTLQCYLHIHNTFGLLLLCCVYEYEEDKLFVLTHKMMGKHGRKDTQLQRF